MSLGLIETVRVSGGRAPLWALHLARLTASARALRLELPARLPGEPEVAAAAAALPDPAAVRLTLRRGALLLEARPVAGGASGWTACPAPRPHPGGPWAVHKTTERAAFQEAAAFAHAQGCDEAIFANAEGRLTEGAITNVFLRRGSRLLTPPLTAGLLPGIARARLLAAGRLAGLPVEERDLTAADLAAADEAFLSNAVRGAVPLLAWDGQALPGGDLWRAARGAILGPEARA